jgi:hypothetical protein
MIQSLSSFSGRALAISCAAIISANLPAWAQSAPPRVSGEEVRSMVSLDPEIVQRQQTCLTRMSGFPVDDPTARYQFFILTETVGLDVDASMLQSLKYFGQPRLPANTPMIEVIEGIANPITLQAQPALTVAQTVSLIEFAQECAPYIRGQIDSLAAIEPSFSDPTFNVTIREDALYLRQMAGDALARLRAHDDAVHGTAISTYDAILVDLRNEIEFTAFESELNDLESLYLSDLDQKLALVNDKINSEMDREVLDDSILISQDMSEATEEERRRRMAQTLFRILQRY